MTRVLKAWQTRSKSNLKRFPLLELFLLAFVPIFHRTMITADAGEDFGRLSTFIAGSYIADVAGLVFTVQAGVGAHGSSPG